MASHVKNKYNRIGCVIDRTSNLAIRSFLSLKVKYPFIKEFKLPKTLSASPNPVEIDKDANYDAIIALGGDGLMLRTMQYFMHKQMPIYGMRRGTVGFLLNDYEPDNLIESIEQANAITLNPLEMYAITSQGSCHTLLAVNEVSLLRQTRQSAHIQISVNQNLRLNHLAGDGVLLATPAGSSAYNSAAHGPIVPLYANILALTPISPFRPRNWNGALIYRDSVIQFDVMQADKRPVSASVDSVEEVRSVVMVQVRERKDIEITLLFNKKCDFEERALKEQFLHI